MWIALHPIVGHLLLPWRAVALVQGWSQGLVQQNGEEQALLVAEKFGETTGKVMELENKNGVRQKKWGGSQVQDLWYPTWETGGLAFPSYS